MSLAQQVAALRALFGTPADVPPLPAIEAMNLAMGMIGEGPLPAQVAELVRATGADACQAQPQAQPQPQVTMPSAGPVPSSSRPASVAASAAAVQPPTQTQPARQSMQPDIRGMMGPKLLLRVLLARVAVWGTRTREGLRK